MADIAGVLGYGSTVRVGRGAGPTWTELEFVTEIQMPEDETDDVEVTHMKSPGRRRQYIAGLTDGGEVEITLNYVPGNPTDLLLRELQAAGTQVLLELTPSDTIAAQPEVFDAFLKGLSRQVPVDDKMEMTATFKVSASVAA